MSELSQHTPGPWEVDDQTAKKFSVRIRAPRIGTRSNPNPAVATIHTPRSWSEGEANAALIAAAPELLAALKQLVAYHLGRKIDRDGNCEETRCTICGERWIGREPNASMGEGHDPDCVALAAEKAIAKAKGGVS